MASLVVGYHMEDFEPIKVNGKTKLEFHLCMRILFQKYRNDDFGMTGDSVYESENGISLVSALVPYLESMRIFVRGARTEADFDILYYWFKYKTDINPLLFSILEYNRKKECHLIFKRNDVCLEYGSIEELRNATY